MLKINHVAIYANNIEKMLGFYCNILEFIELQRVHHVNGNIKMVRLFISKQQTLELFNFNYLNEEIKHKYVNWGYMHIGFGIKNLSIIKEKLVRNCITIFDETACGNDGLKHFFVEDPENNLLEFTEEA